MVTPTDLQEFIRRTLDVRELDSNAAMGKTRGWDSLNQVNLITALEGAYEIEIPPDMVGELASLPSIIKYFQTEGLLQA